MENMADMTNAPALTFTDAAASKVGDLIAQEDNPELKLRVFISGGGCSGFQYGFTFDEDTQDGDMRFENQGVTLLVDPMSFQYLIDAEIVVDGVRQGNDNFWEIQPAVNIETVIHAIDVAVLNDG